METYLGRAGINKNVTNKQNLPIILYNIITNPFRKIFSTLDLLCSLL